MLVGFNFMNKVKAGKSSPVRFLTARFLQTNIHEIKNINRKSLLRDKNYMLFFFNLLLPFPSMRHCIFE